jgi:anti-sigma regulatory factor (Ser/Thr protein kinase)/CheY-like chemotaxis protein
MTSDPELYERVEALKQSAAAIDAEMTQVANADDALEFMNVETPDLAFINFSDPVIDAMAMLDRILEDPWLHHAGIIGFGADSDVGDQLEKKRGINLVAMLVDYEIDRYLPRILNIIGRNQRILCQRGVGVDLVQTLSGSFQLENDTIEANCYANLLCNYLFNSNKIDAGGKMQVHVALVELLINAIEHGNCGVTYAEKSAWLEEGNIMRDLIAQKCQDPVVRAKRVLFEYTIAPDRSTFFIADEGLGFDWRRHAPSESHHASDHLPDNLHALHGRGIKMTRRFTKNLRYNDRGNEVRFAIEHQGDDLSTRPGLFENIPPIAVAPGEIVFREGEAGDFLYYIAKGRYEVIVRDVVVSTLSADDILMGEMAFLLNNRRTATVRAATDGTLIRMSKKDFVEAIKAKPHYGLFLARLLAQRVARSNPK